MINDSGGDDSPGFLADVRVADSGDSAAHGADRPRVNR